MLVQVDGGLWKTCWIRRQFFVAALQTASEGRDLNSLEALVAAGLARKSAPPASVQKCRCAPNRLRAS
jgi:hypothetical protein